MEKTIFHKILAGEAPCHKVWEDDEHLAFLSIFPNTKGVTVVIPKKWQPSYFVEVNDKDLNKLVLAAKKVAKLLDSKLEGVGRTAMVFEGFGVNYLHAKLFPLHNTEGMDKWDKKSSNIKKFFDEYEGYISSHDADMADDDELAKLAETIRS